MSAAQDHKVAAEVEGADAPALTSRVASLFAQAGPAASAVSATAAAPHKAAPEPAEQSAELTARIRKLLASAPVLLFMKGTPEQPRCGFSAKTVAALRDAGVHFDTFDILSNEGIRQGLKVHSPRCEAPNPPLNVQAASAWTNLQQTCSSWA